MLDKVKLEYRAQSSGTTEVSQRAPKFLETALIKNCKLMGKCFGVKHPSHTNSPVAVVLACRERALLLMAGGFEGAAILLLTLVTASLGVLVLVVVAVLELGGLVAPWLPAVSVHLLGRSSGLVPVGAETPADADGKKYREY